MVEVDTMLCLREGDIRVFQHNLCKALHRMKTMVDSKQIDW